MVGVKGRVELGLRLGYD